MSDLVKCSVYTAHNDELPILESRLFYIYLDISFENENSVITYFYDTFYVYLASRRLDEVFFRNRMYVLTSY